MNPTDYSQGRRLLLRCRLIDFSDDRIGMVDASEDTNIENGRVFFFNWGIDVALVSVSKMNLLHVYTCPYMLKIICYIQP